MPKIASISNFNWFLHYLSYHSPFIDDKNKRFIFWLAKKSCDKYKTMYDMIHLIKLNEEKKMVAYTGGYYVKENLYFSVEHFII